VIQAGELSFGRMARVREFEAEEEVEGTQSDAEFCVDQAESVLQDTLS